MKTGNIIAISGGVIGIGVLSYFLFRKPKTSIYNAPIDYNPNSGGSSGNDSSVKTDPRTTRTPSSPPTISDVLRSIYNSSASDAEKIATFQEMRDKDQISGSTNWVIAQFIKEPLDHGVPYYLKASTK